MQRHNTDTKFKFSPANLQKAAEILAKYPSDKKQSAVMPLLDLAQRQNDNWISVEAMDYIADFLQIPPMRVYEVASFYTMYNKNPVGKNLIQVCRTTPCWLNGSDKLTNLCKEHLGIEIGETSKDGIFTLMEVECLGACANAPVVQINDDYYEDLNEENFLHVIEALRQNKKIKVGSQTGRQSSCPASIKPSTNKKNEVADA